MLQPYDWDQPPNYYRLTQRSFAVVVAKLNTISYHTRVNKLNAEDSVRRLATSRAKESAAKAANLNADVMRLMTVRDSLPPSRPRIDRQPEKSDPPAPFAAITTRSIRGESETPTSLGQIKLLVSVVLLAAAMIWAKSKSDPACGEWLVRRSFEILMQVWIVALGVSWGVGKLITIGLGMLGNAVGGWGEELLRSI